MLSVKITDKIYYYTLKIFIFMLCYAMLCYDML